MGQVYEAGEGTTVGTFSACGRGGGTGTRGLVLSWERGQQISGERGGTGTGLRPPTKTPQACPSWAGRVLLGVGGEG